MITWGLTFQSIFYHLAYSCPPCPYYLWPYQAYINYVRKKIGVWHDKYNLFIFFQESPLLVLDIFNRGLNGACPAGKKFNVSWSYASSRFLCWTILFALTETSYFLFSCLQMLLFLNNHGLPLNPQLIPSVYKNISLHFFHSNVQFSIHKNPKISLKSLSKFVSLN
jgi:hypothetical protein